MNTKEKLMQLLELCIDKGLSYEIMHDNKLQVFDWKGEYKFNESCILYYYNSEEKDKIVSQRIESLITKVKNYQP